MDENWVEIVSKEQAKNNKPVLKKKIKKGDSMLDITLAKEAAENGRNKDKLSATFDLGGIRGRSSTMKPKSTLFATVDPGVVRLE